MNILVLSWRGPGHPLAGGAEISTHEHTKGWVKAGHRVTLFTSVFPGGKSEEIHAGVRIIRRGGDIFGVHLAAFFWYLFGQHSKFDLVVDEFHGIPFFTPLYVRVKKLGFIHEVAQKVWSFNPWPKPFNLIPAVVGKIGEPLVFKLLYKQIPFMTVSKSTKKDLVNFGVEIVTVVHNGVTLPRNLPKAAKEKVFTVIYLSVLAKDKGIEDAIKAFELFHHQSPRSKFWIIGKGDSNYTSYLTSLCKFCKFWGYVTERKKFELLSRAQVLLNPSIHEGWGLVNIEANSIGIPVVGYDVAGTRDSVKNGETGYLVEEGRPDLLAEKVFRLTNDPSHYAELSKNALEWSENFTWEKSCSKSLSFIKIAAL